MSYEISIASVAEFDIKDAYLGYNNKFDHLGDRFKIEIIKGIDFIRLDAQAIQIKYDNTRVYYLKNFPFGIHYNLDKTEVLIIGIFATKDNPKKWNR